MKQKFMMLLLAAGILLSHPITAHAQLGKLKDKIAGKKEETGSSEGNSKAAANNKFDKRTFLGNPVTDPVLNEDYKYSDEQKDAEGISGYYYGYWPLTGKIEKVWVRYNNWKYRYENRYESFSDDKLAAVSVYSKDLSDYDANNYVAYKYIDYPAARLMIEKTGLHAGVGDNRTFWSIKPGLMVFNFPAYYYKASDPNDPLKFKFHLDTIAKLGKKAANIYQPSDLESINKVLENQKTAQFVIVAKKREDLEGLNNYDTLKQRLIEVAQKDRLLYNNFKMAVMEKPKATKSGELFTQVKWYNLAKEGMKKSTNLAPGETVLHGFVVDNMRWTTVTNVLGVPQYQYTNYYFVCKRNPNRKNNLSDYFLLPAVIKRQYTGGGNYGDVFFDGAAFGSIDITKEEADAYKAFEPK